MGGGLSRLAVSRNGGRETMWGSHSGGRGLNRLLDL